MVNEYNLFFRLLVLEAGTTDEFSHDGGRRDFLVADGHEVVQEFQ